MPRVTLTFDNGPTPGVTERVLEELDRRGLKATFFVIGRKLRAPGAAAAMRQAQAAGHWIGNHTLTHSVPFGEQPTAEFAAEEIDDTEALIGDCARAERLFRPYGREGRVGPHLFSRAAVSHLLAKRYETVLWNAVPGDWRDPDGWLDVCLAQVAAQPWSVVVLHDIANGCLPRLSALLDRLTENGTEIVQEFPNEIILMRNGILTNLTDSLVPGGIEGLCSLPNSA